MGSRFKEGKCFMNASVRLNGFERTLQFVEVSMKMRHGCVKNIPLCLSGDLCTDG